MARSECTSASVSSNEWAWTSTTSLTPTSQLESCSKILRVFRERCQCQSGSTKRNPKRVRVTPSRTSRTDEAAEPHRLGHLHRDRLKKARKDALGHFFFAQQNASLPRIDAQNDAFGHPNRASEDHRAPVHSRERVPGTLRFALLRGFPSEKVDLRFHNPLNGSETK